MSIRLSTALLLLATVGVWLVGIPAWQDMHREHVRADDRTAALEVATLEVTDLTTLSPKSLDSTLERLKRRLTGAFQQQFQAFYSTFASAIKDDRVTSRGSVQSTALTSLTAHRAVALVAARAVVSSRKQKHDVRRAYRFEVTLSKHGSQWLISGMRFVS